MVAKTEKPQGDNNPISELVSLIQRSGPDSQKAIREALGVGGAIKKAKPTQNNHDAKRIAYSVGEFIAPEGWQPKPSEAKEQEGPEAVAQWLQRWNDRNVNPSNKAEEYAAIAHM